MSEFNIIPEIGGVDTSDLSRIYSPEEQFMIVSSVFGGILLPGDSGDLQVGKRENVPSKKGFSTSAGKIWVPSYPQAGRQLISVDTTVFEDGEYAGILPIAIGSALNAGRLVYKGKTVTRRDQSLEFKRKKERAIRGVISAAGLDGYDHPFGIVDSSAASEIGQWLTIFAGHKRDEVITSTSEGVIDNPYLLFSQRIVDRLLNIRKPRA